MALDETVAGQAAGLVAVFSYGSPEWQNTPWNPVLVTIALGGSGTLKVPALRSEFRLKTAYS